MENIKTLNLLEDARRLTHDAHERVADAITFYKRTSLGAAESAATLAQNRIKVALANVTASIKELKDEIAEATDNDGTGKLYPDDDSRPRRGKREKAS